MGLGDVTTIFENFTIQNSLIVIQHSNNPLRDLRACFAHLAVKPLKKLSYIKSLLSES